MEKLQGIQNGILKGEHSRRTMKNNEEKNTQRSDVVAHTCQLSIWKAEPGGWKFKASFSYTASSKAAWLHKNPAQKQTKKKCSSIFPTWWKISIYMLRKLRKQPNYNP